MNFELSFIDIDANFLFLSKKKLVTYEALGLCDIGKAGEMIDKGDNTFGGKYVINPSGIYFLFFILFLELINSIFE